MNIYCLGINHRTAPIEVREKLFFSAEETREFLASAKSHSLRECVLVSTCNRTELYYVAEDQHTNGQPLWQVLAASKRATDDVLEQHFYKITSLNVVRHLFNVTAGVDSMVPGDVQISHQIKEAYAFAQEHGTTGFIFNRLFSSALHTSKRAKSETDISEGAVSISYAAAELASKIFEDLSKKSALLIGTGETGTLTAKHLSSRNLGNLILANRTRQHAEDLARQLGAKVIEFTNLRSEIHHADIIISSVDAEGHILTAKELRSAMNRRKHKPLYIIDIGVPRNIDPAANDIENVFLHDIDGLNHIVESSLSRRLGEIHKVREIVFQELVQFYNWYNGLQVTPTIQELKEQFETIRRAEVEKHHHHFDNESYERVELLTKRMMNKILHMPLVNLKDMSTGNEDQKLRTKLHLIRFLFGLDEGKINR